MIGVQASGRSQDRAWICAVHPPRSNRACDRVAMDYCTADMTVPAGISNQKLLPRPGSLRTSMTPFIASMMHLEVARPSPAPTNVERMVWFSCENSTKSRLRGGCQNFCV